MVQEPEFLQEKTKAEASPALLLRPANLALIGGVVVFVIIMGIALFRQNQSQPLPGAIAPSFDLVGYDGQVYNSTALRGQIVVLNLWADWCAPCHDEAPELEQIYREYQADGVLLIGVNWLDIEADALGFIERYDISYPNAPDVGERFYEAYNIQGPPETFVINRDGIIAATFIGAVTYDQLAQVLETLLAEGA